MRVKRRPLFTILRVLGLFVMGLAVAVVIALSQVNLETLRGNVVAMLRDATGMPVEIDGAVAWKFSLRPRVELNQVRVLNANWAKHKYAFSAEKIDVTLNLVSLLRNRPTIQNVKVYDATICLEKNSAGKYSVQRIEKDGSTQENVADASVDVPEKYPFKDFGLGGVEIKNLVAHIVDDTYSIAGVSVRYFPNEIGLEYAGWIRSNDEEFFPFVMSFSEYNAERKVYPMRIAIASEGESLVANVALEGKSKEPIDFIVKGIVANPGAVGKIFNMDLTGWPKIAVNLAGGLDRKKLTLRKSSVAVRGFDFTVQGDYDWGKQVPVLNLDVSGGNVALDKLFPNLYGRGTWIRPNRKLNIFKDVPLYGQFFVDQKMNVNLALKSLGIYKGFGLGNLNIAMQLADNVARIDIKSIVADGGLNIGADVQIDPQGVLFVQMASVGDRIYVGDLLHQFGVDNFISGLPMNIEMYVRGHGADLSGLMQTVTGPVKVYSVAPGYAHSDLVAYMYGTDFLTSLRHSIEDLFSSEKEHNQIKISCAAMNVKLRDGAFFTEHGVAIETNAINVRLAGDLNLGGETLKLALTTVPVRGIKLSLTGKVVNSIELSGNLAEPDVSISGMAVAGKVASATGIGLLLAPFTGGIGLVAGAGVGWVAGDLLENWLADVHPCETALEKGAPAHRGDPEWINAPLEDLIGEILTK